MPVNYNKFCYINSYVNSKLKFEVHGTSVIYTVHVVQDQFGLNFHYLHSVVCM